MRLCSYKISFTKKQTLCEIWSAGYSLPVSAIDPFSSSDFRFVIPINLYVRDSPGLAPYAEETGKSLLDSLSLPTRCSVLPSSCYLVLGSWHRMALFSPFAFWLLVDFSALETMAGIQSMGGELGCLFPLPPCWQWFGEMEFLSNSPSSLQLPAPLFLDPGHFLIFGTFS